MWLCPAPLNPDALKALRTSRNLTQGQLAELTGVTKTQISRWERGIGIAGLRADSKEGLCAALNTTWEQLAPIPAQVSTKALRKRAEALNLPIETIHFLIVGNRDFPEE